MTRTLALLAALALGACTVESTRPLPRGKEPLVVSADGQELSLDTAKVPVVPACAAGSVPRRDTAGLAWECVPLAWETLSGRPSLAPAIHTHAADQITDFDAAAARALSRETVPGRLTVSGTVQILSGSLYSVTWAEPSPFGDTWSDQSGYQKVQYEKIGDLVVLRGVATSSNSSFSTQKVIFTLPEGFRPPNNGKLAFSAITSGSLAARIEISPNGEVAFAGGGASGWISLSGIFFSVDEF